MKLNIIPKAVLRMAGYPIDILDNHRIVQENISLEDFVKQSSQIRKNIRELYINNPDIQEAIWTSSQEIHRSLNKKFRDIDVNNSRNHKDRRWELLVTKYLFRFCYKNDTTSFFGPSSYIPLNSDQNKSIIGNLNDIVAERENTTTRTASWVEHVPFELVEEYRLAKGVDSKSKVLQRIISEAKGKQRSRPWKWYTERTPVYDLCPADSTFSIGGKLLKDIILKGNELHKKMVTFNSFMHKEAIDNGFYIQLKSFLQEKTKSVHVLAWFEYIYNSENLFLNELTEHMNSYGKLLFEKIFLNNNSVIHDIQNNFLSPFFSPDLMINSESAEEINEGIYNFIISDIHGTLTCFLNTFSHSLDSDSKANIVNLLNKRIFDKSNFYLPSYSIPDRVKWLDEFNVIKDISELKVLEKEGKLFYNKENVYVEFFLNEVISKIIPLGSFGLDEFMPQQYDRINFNGTTIKRKSMKISSKDFLDYTTPSEPKDKNKKWCELFTRTRKYLSDLNLGEVIFVKPDCEYKSFAMDINNPFCCEILKSYAKRSKSMGIQEMLPGKEGLWLKNSRGKYTSEIRISFYEGKK